MNRGPEIQRTELNIEVLASGLVLSRLHHFIAAFQPGSCCHTHQRLPAPAPTPLGPGMPQHLQGEEGGA
jgi:hypothetical protein